MGDIKVNKAMYPILFVVGGWNLATYIFRFGRWRARGEARHSYIKPKVFSKN